MIEDANNTKKKNHNSSNNATDVSHYALLISGTSRLLVLPLNSSTAFVATTTISFDHTTTKKATELAKEIKRRSSINLSEIFLFNMRLGYDQSHSL